MKLTRLFALAHGRLMDAYAVLRREDGQGMSEYTVLLVGIVLLVGTVTAAVTLWIQGQINLLP